MTPRTTGLLIMIGGTLGALGSLIVLIGVALEDGPLWRVLAQVAIVIGAAVIAVFGYRQWKRPVPRE